VTDSRRPLCNQAVASSDRHRGRAYRADMRAVVRVSSSILTFVLIGGVLLTPHPAAAASATSDTALRWVVTIDGRNVQSADANQPLQLHPDSGARVSIRLENSGTKSIEVRRFRMRGQVMGLTFFSYATDLNVILPAKTHTTRHFEIDLADLSGQANGLIPSQVQLLGPSRQTIAERDFTADVRGSVLSVYGVFGLAVAAITALLIAGLLLVLLSKRRRLPTNRWLRAVRFLPVGIGVGFTLTFSLSATRQLVPSTGLWVSLVVGCGAAAFLIGYFTPTGNVDEAEEADETEVHVPQQATRDVSDSTRWHSRRHRGSKQVKESSSASDELP
jgi:hypothetical protein